MKIAIISANLGGYEIEVPWTPQVVPGALVTIYRLTDATCPPRYKAMLPSLQCGIAKMFGWQLFPGHDVYIWIDASRGLLRPDTAAWFCHQADGADLLLFRHPERATVREEYEFVRAKLEAGSRYLTKRYAGEWLEDQYAAVRYRPDATLYASTAFLYRPTSVIRALLKDWWYHKTRYLLHDQIALPSLVETARALGAQVKVIDDSVYACAHLPMTRIR